MLFSGSHKFLLLEEAYEERFGKDSLDEEIPEISGFYLSVDGKGIGGSE